LLITYFEIPKNTFTFLLYLSLRCIPRVFLNLDNVHTQTKEDESGGIWSRFKKTLGIQRRLKYNKKVNVFFGISK
jgi:hypothetical protein